MFSAFTLQTKLIVLGILLVTITGGAIWIYNSIENGGYERCRAEVKEESQKAKDDAHRVKIEEEKKREADTQKLHETVDSGVSLGPISAGVIDRLHERAAKRLRQ